MVPFFSKKPMSLPNLSAKSIQTDTFVGALARLLIEKKIFTHDEYDTMTNKLLMDYEEQILNDNVQNL